MNIQLANYVQLVLMWQQMPEIQSQTKNLGHNCLTKKIILLCIYFTNYLLLFAIKIKLFEQTDNNIRSFVNNKRIISYANFVLGIAT